MDRRKGFTLIELLVVLAVISMLAAVLFPALTKSKEQAIELICTSKQRQLFLSCGYYCQNNDGRLPYGYFGATTSAPPGGYLGDASKDYQGWWWFHFLDLPVDSEFNKSSVTACPARKTALSSNPLVGNYGINLSICRIYRKDIQEEFLGEPERIESLKNPSNTRLLMDSGYALISWQTTTENTTVSLPELSNRLDFFYLPGLTINKNLVIQENFQSDAAEGRHRSEVNISFIDGSTKKIVPDTLLLSDDETERSYLMTSWRGH